MSAFLKGVFGSERYILNGRLYHREEVDDVLAKSGDAARFGLFVGDQGRYGWLCLPNNDNPVERLSAFIEAAEKETNAKVPRWTSVHSFGGIELLKWDFRSMHPAAKVEQHNQVWFEMAVQAGLSPVADTWRKDSRWPVPNNNGGAFAGIGAEIAQAPREPQPLALVDLADYEGPLPLRQWHIDGVTMRGHVTGIAGRAGAGKSGLGLKLAICCALGRSWDDFHVHYAANVLFLSVEDDMDEKRRRLEAVCAGLGIQRSQLKGKLYTMDCADLVLMTKNGETGRAEPTALYDDLLATIKARDIGLLFIDPLIEVHSGLDENSNTDMKEIVVALRSIARKVNMPVMFVHHTRKGAAVGDQDAARGGTALVANVRNMLILDPLPEKFVEQVPAGTATDHFLLTMAKSNYSRRGAPKVFRRVSHSLGNGPNGGDSAADIVLVSLETKSAEDWEHLDEFLIRVAEGEWKMARNAKKGNRLIDLLEKFGEGDAMEKSLLAEGIIEAVVKTDRQGNQTTLAAVGNRLSPTAAPTVTYGEGTVGVQKLPTVG